MKRYPWFAHLHSIEGTKKQVPVKLLLNAYKSSYAKIVKKTVQQENSPYKEVYVAIFQCQSPTRQYIPSSAYQYPMWK